MSRTVLASVLLLGCSAIAAIGAWESSPVAHALAAGIRPAEPRFAHPLQRARDCKPLAPVSLQLAQTGATDGSVVELSFSITPHADVGPVAWELQLPAGSVLLDGETSGTCDAAGAGSGPRHARVRLGTAQSLARITLVASGALLRETSSGSPDAQANGTAPAPLVSPSSGPSADVVRASSSLSWGDPQAELAAALPHRRLLALDNDGTRRLVQLPTRHRSGR